MSNTQDITVHLYRVSTTDSEIISIDSMQEDCKVYNLNGYQVQSATEPGIYISNGVKILKE